MQDGTARLFCAATGASTGAAMAVHWPLAALVMVGLLGGSVPLAHGDGDVTVTLSDEGKLKITGDSESNGVDVRPGVDPGTVEVSGLDDTTINGSTAPLTLTGVQSLSADLKKGDDTLEVRDLGFTGKVKVELGNGTNTILLDTVTAQKKVKLTGGKSGDSITLRRNSSFASELLVESGGGPDSITLNDVSCGGDVNISTSGGGDFVEIRATVLASAGELELETAGGNDTLDLVNDNFEGKVDIDLGDNDDDLAVQGCDFDERVEINGGGGDDDEADNQGGNAFDFGEVIRIWNFEDIE
jgi:hypothetical protein